MSSDWKKKAIIGGAGVAAVMAAGAVAGYKILHPTVMVKGKGSTVVACVGDSITFGQGVLGRRDTQSYPALLAKNLGDAYTVKNYGLSNRTLLSTGDMPYFNEEVGRRSLESGADIVLFMLGSNDSKKKNWNRKQYRKEYEEALERYKAMPGKPKVYALIPPKVFIENPSDKTCNDEIINDEIRKMIPEIAKEKNAEVIDLYIFTKYHPEWFADKIHPNRKGNEAIAEYLADIVV